MELHNHRIQEDPQRRLDPQPAQPLREEGLEATIDRVTAAREARQEQLQGLAERTRARRERLTDSLDLSAAARVFGGEDADATRASLIESLRAAYESGDLNTHERIQRAAHHLLGGS